MTEFQFAVLKGKADEESADECQLGAHSSKNLRRLVCVHTSRNILESAHQTKNKWRFIPIISSDWMEGNVASKGRFLTAKDLKTKQYCLQNCFINYLIIILFIHLFTYIYYMWYMCAVCRSPCECVCRHVYGGGGGQCVCVYVCVRVCVPAVHRTSVSQFS